METSEADLEQHPGQMEEGPGEEGSAEVNQETSEGQEVSLVLFIKKIWSTAILNLGMLRIQLLHLCR